MAEEAEYPLPTELPEPLPPVDVAGLQPKASDPNNSQDALNAKQQPEQSHADDGIEGEQLEAPKDTGKKSEVVQPRIVATPCRAEPQHETKEATSPSPSVATSNESEVPNLGDSSPRTFLPTFED